MVAWIDDVVNSRLTERFAAARSRADVVVESLASMGIRVRVVGSLVNGRFALHSDVDFLIEECPRQLKYGIESIVESVMLDIPFDVIYGDEAEVV
jgi:predicted nucleotidyltransferase